MISWAFSFFFYFSFSHVILSTYKTNFIEKFILHFPFDAHPPPSFTTQPQWPTSISFICSAISSIKFVYMTALTWKISRCLPSSSYQRSRTSEESPISSATSRLTIFFFPLAFFDTWRDDLPLIFDFDNDIVGNHFPVFRTTVRKSQKRISKIPNKRTIPLTLSWQWFTFVCRLRLGVMRPWHSESRDTIPITPLGTIDTLFAFYVSRPDDAVSRSLKSFAIITLRRNVEINFHTHDRDRTHLPRYRHKFSILVAILAFS